MNICLIASRSLTYAQRSVRVLAKAGYAAYVMRMPAGMTGNGCGYAVKVSENDLHKAVGCLRQNGFEPKRAYLVDKSERSIEVSI